MEVPMAMVDQIKSLLNLKPLPVEGGYYVETYRSHENIPRNALPDRYDAPRSLATSIYYLLTANTFSAIHRLPTDEIYHFYLGDPVEMLLLSPDESGQVVTLGPDILQGMRPQVVVSKGVWQGSRLLPGGEFALLGTTMSPGFEFSDFESGQREVLVASYPQFRDLIMALTK